VEEFDEASEPRTDATNPAQLSNTVEEEKEEEEEERKKKSSEVSQLTVA
jgi:hypothetical protein